MLVIVLVCFFATWMSGLMDARIDQFLDSGRVYDPHEMPEDGRPAFVATVRSKSEWWPAPPNASFRQRLDVTYFNLKRRLMDRLGMQNPAAYTIGFTLAPNERLQLYQGLNQCGKLTGTRYLIAREAWGRKTSFGSTNLFNGAQFVAAFEQALRDDGLLLIIVRRGVVKVVLKNKLDEYRKAGLVKVTN